MAGACRTWPNRGTFRRDRTSGGSRRRHGGASAPYSSATPWHRGSPPTWWEAVEGKRSQPEGGRQAQSAERARARAGFRGLRGGRRPPGDRQEAPRRQRQPPDPAADTCEHGGRCQPNPLLEPPAAARGRAREGVRCAKFAGLLGGILPQGVLVEGFGGRRHHLQVPKRGTLPGAWVGQLAGQLGSLVAGQRRAANRVAGTVATWLADYVAHTQQLWWGVRGLILAERPRGEGRLRVRKST